MRLARSVCITWRAATPQTMGVAPPRSARARPKLASKGSKLALAPKGRAAPLGAPCWRYMYQNATAPSGLGSLPLHLTKFEPVARPWARPKAEIARKLMHPCVKVVDTLLGGSFCKIDLFYIENLCPTACAMLYRGIE